MSNLLLDRACYFPAPYRLVDDVREKTISALRQGSVQEGADVETAMQVQTLMIEYAERFFDRLRDELKNALKKYPGHDL